MSQVIKITRRFIFVIFICVCLNYSAIAMERQPGIPPAGNSSNFSSYSTQSASRAESPVGGLSAPSYVRSESLLLLLSGIAMFVGATTVRKALEKRRPS
jgi:hypothetical protein